MQTRRILSYEDHIHALTPFGKAYLASTHFALGKEKRAGEIIDMIMDSAQEDPMIGVYWQAEKYSWIWYSDSVEKHAFILRTLHTITRDMVKNTTQCCQPIDRAAHTAHTTRLGEEALASMVACSFSKADMAKHNAHLRRMWKEHANALVARGWSKDRVHALCGQYERPCDKVSALAMARWP